ncbi:MAG: histidine phosphatase family protein [Alphaproteobacteria bacterium]|nr:histidine phosphatase family protein [Alphaproteobacteria bacterium]MBQ9235636.1 histidine phosphatase family protein [Alphaproteobacteria bacterium]
MRKDFYIFRHGETDYNQAQRWQGQGVDIDLNANGRQQAEVLAQKLADCGLQVIYSSPLKRAKQTAQYVAAGHNLEIRILPELTEGSVGDCEGMSKSEVAKKYPQVWDIWYGDNDIMDVRWPNGESKGEVQQRMNRAFAEMLLAKEKVIGVASHGAAIRYFLLQFGYGPHKMENTALFHLVWEDEKWILDGVNL